jgi:hypothetical protein
MMRPILVGIVPIVPLHRRQATGMQQNNRLLGYAILGGWRTAPPWRSA